MPYQRTIELPESMRSHLPPQAQEIYRTAFEKACQNCGRDEDEARRVAWEAVAHHYRRDAYGVWIPKKRDVGSP